MKLKIFLGLIGLFFLIGLFSYNHSQNTAVEGLQTKATVPTHLPTKAPAPTLTPAPKILPTSIPTPTIIYKSTNIQQSSNDTTGSDGLSNNNYYSNSDGNQVHSPAYSTNGNVPAGATAQCSDGTYSFSQHRSGTCSHHGGVATWY